MDTIKMSLYEALQVAAEQWEAAEDFFTHSDCLAGTLEPVKTTLDCQTAPVPAPKISRVRRWTHSEDMYMVEVVQRYKFDWRKIAKHFPDKTISVLKRRWENKIDPDIKRTPWTPEEDELLQSLLKQVGPVWKTIAKSLPGRPPDVVKNRYYGHIKRMKDLRCRRQNKTEKGKVLPPNWEDLLVAPEPEREGKKPGPSIQ